MPPKNWKAPKYDKTLDSPARRRLAYQYFESLGPTRTIVEVATTGHYGSYGAIRNWAAKYKWFDQARKHDEKVTTEFVERNKSAYEHALQTTVGALNFALEKIVERDQDGNIVSVNLKIESPEDVIKTVRLLSYLIGEDPEKTAGLRDGNYHLAVVALLQEFKAKGYDPFIEQLEAFKTTGTPLLEKPNKVSRARPASNGSGKPGEQAMEAD